MLESNLTIHLFREGESESVLSAIEKKQIESVLQLAHSRYHLRLIVYDNLRFIISTNFITGLYIISTNFYQGLFIISINLFKVCS